MFARNKIACIYSLTLSVTFCHAPSCSQNIVSEKQYEISYCLKYNGIKIIAYNV